MALEAALVYRPDNGGRPVVVVATRNSRHVEQLATALRVEIGNLTEIGDPKLIALKNVEAERLSKILDICSS